MKISELTNKSFLGKAGVAANSYVLINYAEDGISTPVTYKATIEELGNAITQHLKIPFANNDGPLQILTVEDSHYDNMPFSRVAVFGDEDKLVYYEEGGSNPTNLTLQNLSPIEYTTDQNEEIVLYPLLVGSDDKYYALDDSGIPTEITL